MHVASGPHSELTKYVERLGRRLAREQRAANEDELRKLYRLLDKAEAWVPADDEDLFVGPARPSRGDLEDEYGTDPGLSTRPPAKPRHRPADEFPWATIERLDELLADRRTALETGSSIEGLSQEAIASELSALPPGLKFDDTRVQRAEKVRNMALESKGWDLRALLRSHLEFCAGNDKWSLPTPDKAAGLLGL